MTRTQVFFGTRAEKQSRITQPSRRRLVFHFGDAILPHAQYGPYYVTVFFWGGGVTVMADSWAGLYSLH